MRTKTFSAKKLLSLLLTVAMFATMILPTNVFAAVSDISTTLGTDKLYVDVEADFTVTTVANDDLNKMVMGQFVIENADEDDIASLTYYGVMEDAYLTLPIADDGAGNLVGQFGPATTGFPMSDATSKFKVTFKNAGDYEVNVSVVEFGTTNVVASCDATVEVVGYADYTALTAAIAKANNCIANESLYTTASINAVKDAKDVAENVNDKLYADNTSAITNAITDIEDAIAALEELADYTDLTVAYNTGKAISNANGTYTTKTFEVLTEALKEVEKDANKELTVQDDVDALTKAINDAIAGLVKNVEVTFTAVAVANDAKVDYAKANKIVLVFAEPVKDDANKLVSKLNIADKVSAANWTTDTVYTLTLKGDHGLSNNAEVAFDGDETIFTVSGNAMADTKANVIGNLTEAYQQVTATKMAATIVNNDDKPGADAGDKIVLVFNAPVKDNPDDITVSGMTAEVVAGTYNTVYVITLDGTENVNDDTKLTFGTIANVELNGTFGTAVAPKALVAVAIDKDGTAKKTNDEIVVVFDRPTNGSEDISALSIFSDAEWNGANTELTLKVAGETGINSTIDISSMGIMDKDSIVAATNTSNLALLGSFGTVTAPAVLSMTAVDVDGTAKTEGDLVVIVFDRPTNGSVDISGLADFVDAKWNTTKTELTLTVGAGATINNGATLDIASMGIKDKDGLVDATNTSVKLAGSFGTVVAPVINSAYAVDNDGEATVAGDMIVITFDRPTNGAAIDLKKDGIIANQATTFGSTSKFDWADGNTKLIITLGTNANVENGVELDLSNQGIMDADSIIDAAISPVVVEGSFGSSLEPKITRAIAFTQNNKHIIRTFFNTEVVVKENGTLDVYVKNFDTPKGTWTTNGISYYDIVLEEGHDELEAGAVIKFEGTLVDKKTGKMELKDAEIVINGGFEQDIDMEILSLTAYSNDGSGIAKAGDRIVLVLNSEATSVTCDLGTFETDDNITWVYTLKSDNEVEIAKDVTFSAIKSKTNGKTYSNMKANIGGSFGYVVEPKLLSATAYSKDGSGIAKKGDEIIVVFDSKVSGVTSSLGAVSSDDGIVWKITLGDNPTITVGTTLNFAVKSVATGKEYNNLSVDLGGSFGKVVEPQILSATAYSNDGSGIAKAGDKIVVVFNAPVLYVTSALGSVSTNDNIVWTIELGTNPTITVGTDLTFDVTSVATNKEHKGLKINLAGSFGEIVNPEIISVTAISNDGSGVAKVGDKIVVVFDTEVKVGNADAAATYVYTYTLTADDIASNKYAIGAGYSVDVWSVATGKKYTLNSIVDGSYGYSEVPTVKSVVLAEDKGIETVTVVFDGAIDIYEADGITKKAVNVDTLKEKNAHLGKQTDAVSAKWIDEYRLEITLGANTTTTDASKLDLTGLGIKAKATGIALEDGAISDLAISGTLIPVVKEVKAAGKNIIISFSTRTNGVANISNLTALLGTGAVANWTDNDKTLTITLGENYTVTNNGYIVLNGMGIYDAFSGNYHVVGQYKILGSIDSDKLAVTKVVAQSTDKSKTTAQKGDTIVIKFNSATDLKGAALNQILDANKVDEIITIDGGNEAALGTGYTGEWTAYDTLVITLGGKTIDNTVDPAVETGNDPAISVGTAITVANVKFANGEGLMDATSVELSGSFNGREFILTEGAITRTGANNTGDYRIAVKVEDTLLAPSVVPTVVCVAYNGTSPVSVMRICVDVENTIQPVFEFAEGLKITSAKIYVFNELFGDVNSSPSVLAETLEIK